MKIDHSKPADLPVQIATSIRDAIIEGRLIVDERLPSEAELAEKFAARVDRSLPDQTYEVFLNDKGKLRWRGLENGEEIILDKEPQTTWGKRAKANFMRILPIRGQL